MIFVTVGTHEQPFNRLIEYMDSWAGEHDEKVIIQTGYSTFEPQNASWKKMFSYQDMIKNIDNAHIVITHGSPGSFILPLKNGKIPIVVPRKKEFNEHVNNHQLEFSLEIAERLNNIIVVENIKILKKVIDDYEEITGSMNTKIQSNNTLFCDRFEKIVSEMVKKE